MSHREVIPISERETPRFKLKTYNRVAIGLGKYFCYEGHFTLNPTLFVRLSKIGYIFVFVQISTENMHVPD